MGRIPQRRPDCTLAPTPVHRSRKMPALLQSAHLHFVYQRISPTSFGAIGRLAQTPVLWGLSLRAFGPRKLMKIVFSTLRSRISIFDFRVSIVRGHGFGAGIPARSVPSSKPIRMSRQLPHVASRNRRRPCAGARAGPPKEGFNQAAFRSLQETIRRSQAWQDRIHMLQAWPA